MTQATVEPLYRSARVYQFQAEGVARAYLMGDALVVWSTGIGKSHLAMALSALLFEDDLIDLVLLVCEEGKLSEWLGDYRTFTKLDAGLYRGDPARREKIRNEMPQVAIGTYETIRNDTARKIAGRQRALEAGPLTEVLSGRRVLVIYDEMAKLKNRTSQTYRNHEFFLRTLRREGEARVVGLTATPMERDPENVLNVARLVSPGICTVAQFEKDHVTGRDHFGRAWGYHNLGDDDHTQPWVEPLAKKLEPILLKKDLHDDDVRHEFPQRIEEFSFVDIPAKLREFYTAVSEVEAPGPLSERALAMVLRQIVGHPQAILSSQGELAQWIVGEVGVEGIKALPAPKVDALVHMLKGLVEGEGLQAIVFTFFGQSVLPLIREALVEAEISVAINHGGLSSRERDEQKDLFRAGERSVFLTSDAGSKGINLPEAAWTINFEMPLLYSTYEQRIGRNFRIDSEREQVFVRNLIARDTIEEALAASVMRRNEWWDSFITSRDAAGERAYQPTAAERQLLMRLAQEQSAEEA